MSQRKVSAHRKAGQIRLKLLRGLYLRTLADAALPPFRLRTPLAYRRCFGHAPDLLFCLKARTIQ
jgi:hypothetical protein